MSSFNVGRLSAAVFVALYIGTTHASGVEPRIFDKSEHPRFNEAFLRGDGIDLAQFLAQGAITPGQYRVELYLNTQLVSMESINFKSLDNDVKPCLSSELLARIGVRQAAIDQGLFKNGPYSATCLDIDNIEYASWDYDTGAQKLFLSFPQAQLERDIRGYVSPALWEEG
ncbi:FimD/PapC N-terminal domain-containing protein [Aeromonas salmonicida]